MYNKFSTQEKENSQLSTLLQNGKRNVAAD